ncbi:MAG: hypothetical protein OXP37_01760 [Chloroflexota bacterium]|nr:hypothetical protein [Chloroflexota bacterium]
MRRGGIAPCSTVWFGLLVALAALAMFAPLAPVEAQTARCVPEAMRPVAAAGPATTESSSVGFTVEVRHAGAPAAVNVHVWVTRNGGSGYSASVMVPASPSARMTGQQYRRTKATLSVPRRPGDQVVAITITDHAGYFVCKPHAGVSFQGVRQSVPPRPPQVIPEPDPPQTPEQAVAAIAADAPPRPDPAANLTDSERRKAWRCWAAFGNTEALREAGLLGPSETC